MLVVQQRNLRYGEKKSVEAENLASELIKEFRDVYHIK